MTVANPNWREAQSDLSYGERLANYEKEKMTLPREISDYQTYEAALKALAQKWRI